MTISKWRCCTPIVMLSALLLEGRSISTYTFFDGMPLHEILAPSVYLGLSNYKGRGFGDMSCIDHDKLQFLLFSFVIRHSKLRACYVKLDSLVYCCHSILTNFKGTTSGKILHFLSREDGPRENNLVSPCCML